MHSIIPSNNIPDLDHHHSLHHHIEEGGKEEAQQAGAFSVLLILVSCVVYTSHAVHHSKLTFITEGSLALMWGLVAGGGFFYYFEHVKGTHIPQTLVSFNYDTYMNILLPPIIFYAGFSIKKRHFFANFGALTTMGVAGTVAVAVVLSLIFSKILHSVGLDTHALVGNTIALGTIFASTDSVAALSALDGTIFPQLHALVFGEAVVNDATAIVLLRAVQNIRSEAQLTPTVLASVLKSFMWLSISSMALGFGLALVCSFILKRAFYRRHSTDHEVSLLAAFGFLSYLLAEYLQLSGVFSIFFCGLTLSHYAWHSLSPSAKVSSVHSFRVLSFLAEMLMFLSCGLDLWSNQLWQKDVLTKKVMFHKMLALAGWITVIVPIARFAVALPLLACINLWRRHRPGTCISWMNMMAVSWAGCARGAVTLALSVNHFVGSSSGHEIEEENRIIAASAMVAVVVSTMVLGGATPSIFRYLLHKKSQVSPSSSSSSLLMCEEMEGRGNDTPMRGFVVQNEDIDDAVIPSQEQGKRVVVSGINRIKYGALRDGFHQKWVTLDRNLLQPLFGGRSMSFRMPDEYQEIGGEGCDPGNSNTQQQQQQQQPPSSHGASAADPNALGGHISPFNIPVQYNYNTVQAVLNESRRRHRLYNGLSMRGSFNRLETVDDDVLDELLVSRPGGANDSGEVDVDREIKNEGLDKVAEDCLC